MPTSSPSGSGREAKILRERGIIPMFVRSGYQLPRAEDYAGTYRHRHLTRILLPEFVGKP
jgi:hypothetical protein